MNNDELIEKWAIKLALGNNGGQWADHYVEEYELKGDETYVCIQKDFWRGLAKEMLEDAKNDLT
jgi:hypothetical protein